MVHPGADPSQIRLAYRGADGAHLNDKGQLEVTTAAGGFTDDRPTSYQETDGKRVPVSSNWAADATNGTFALPVGAYDATRDLVIDPVQFVYAGVIGGDGGDAAYSIAVDSQGSAYITGWTYSSAATFPATVGPDLTLGDGPLNYDAFVAKLNPTGTALDYAGYLGGSGNESVPYDSPPGNRIAVDSFGNAYVTGDTQSTDFPVAGFATGLSSSPHSSDDAFVTKVNHQGTALVYSGYLGSGQGFGIAVDGGGDAYVTGFTGSRGFPVKVGPSLADSGGNQAFVTKLDPAGSIAYLGFLGTGATQAYSIAVDSTGRAYVTGLAFSSATFASSTASFGPSFVPGSLTDAFVARVKADGTGLEYAGFMGGPSCQTHGCPYAGYTEGTGIAVDGRGAAYVTGFTHPATNAQFSPRPTVGPDLTFNGGGFDAFVVKLNPAGTGADYSGFIGGNLMDRGAGIAVDSTGAAYVTGFTSSYPNKFPLTKDAPDSTLDGKGVNGFLVKVAPSGAGIVYGTYIGAAQSFAEGVAADAYGNAYVTGHTGSGPLAPAGTPGVNYRFASPTNNKPDAFVIKVSG